MVNVLSDKHQLQNLRSAQSTAVPKYELTDDGLRVLVFFFFLLICCTLGKNLKLIIFSEACGHEEKTFIQRLWRAMHFDCGPRSKKI